MHKIFFGCENGLQSWNPTFLGVRSPNPLSISSGLGNLTMLCALPSIIIIIIISIIIVIVIIVIIIIIIIIIIIKFGWIIAARGTLSTWLRCQPPRCILPNWGRTFLLKKHTKHCFQSKSICFEKDVNDGLGSLCVWLCALPSISLLILLIISYKYYFYLIV